mmetsp:Transcript_7984/g.11460  ORF Transcript_7984/g.11460 Transcript_7984/m.11460 type:complete len:109 (+) Transcript_7984:179-505(+)
MNDRKRNFASNASTRTTNDNSNDNETSSSSLLLFSGTTHNGCKRLRRNSRNSMISNNSNNSSNSTMEEELQCAWCEEYKPTKEFRHSSPTSANHVSICTYCSFHRIAI